MCLGQEDAADLRAPLRASQDDIARFTPRSPPPSRGSPKATTSSSAAETARRGPAVVTGGEEPRKSGTSTYYRHTRSLPVPGKLLAQSISFPVLNASLCRLRRSCQVWYRRSKHWLWAGIVCVSALIAGAALVAPGRSAATNSARGVHRGAAAQSANAERAQTPSYALASPSSTTQFADRPTRWGYGHRVLRYELYDNQGTSPPPAGLPDPEAGRREDRPLLPKPSSEAASIVLDKSQTALSQRLRDRSCCRSR